MHNKSYMVIKRYILPALAVSFFGYFMLILAFLLDALFQGIIRGIFSLFRIPVFPPLLHLLFIALICIISWYLLRSKLRVLFKAIFLTAPLAAVFATIGMFAYPHTMISIILGSIFGISVIYVLYRTRSPWLYYYTLAYICILMLMVVIFEVEI